MAQLPNSGFLVQSEGIRVFIVNPNTDEVLVEFDASSGDSTARAQQAIHNLPLDPEDKSFAHFWSGYFYAHIG